MYENNNHNNYRNEQRVDSNESNVEVKETVDTVSEAPRKRAGGQTKVEILKAKMAAKKEQLRKEQEALKAKIAKEEKALLEQLKKAEEVEDKKLSSEIRKAYFSGSGKSEIMDIIKNVLGNRED